MTKEEIIRLPLEEISREESYTKAILPLMLIHSCKEASLEIRYVVLKTTSMEGPFKGKRPYKKLHFHINKQ